MRHTFIGGPLDGEVYSTQALLAPAYLPTRVPIEQYRWTHEVQKKNGTETRVWLHLSLPDRVTQSSPDGPAKNRTKENIMTDTVEYTALEQKRRDLKVSRKALADAAGLTQAQLYRIERGGARTTEEETATVAKALESFEATAARTEAAADPS